MNYLVSLWGLTAQMAPYLLFGFMAAGVLHVLTPKKWLKKIEAPTVSSVFWAALIGVPMPLCSCSVIPVAAGFNREGASKGATIAFLTATPNTGVDSIAATYGLLGGVFTALRVVFALVVGIVAGVLTNMVDSKNKTVINAQPEQHSSCCHKENKQKQPASKNMFQYAFGDLVNDIGPWLLGGLVMGSLISYALPENMIKPFTNSTVIMFLMMTLIGIPSYICATASIPIALAMMMKGVSPGAAMVFLLVGPATNVATVSFVLGRLGVRIVCIYLATIIGLSWILGFGVDLIWQEPITNMVRQKACEHGLLWWQQIAAVILILLMIKSVIAKMRKKWNILTF